MGTPMPMSIPTPTEVPQFVRITSKLTDEVEELRTQRARLSRVVERLLGAQPISIGEPNRKDPSSGLDIIEDKLTDITEVRGSLQDMLTRLEAAGVTTDG